MMTVSRAVSLFSLLCLCLIGLTLPGCGRGSEPATVAESEDEIAAYEEMLEEMQEETASEAESVRQ